MKNNNLYICEKNEIFSEVFPLFWQKKTIWECKNLVSLPFVQYKSGYFSQVTHCLLSSLANERAAFKKKGLVLASWLKQTNILLNAGSEKKNSFFFFFLINGKQSCTYVVYFSSVTAHSTGRIQMPNVKNDWQQGFYRQSEEQSRDLVQDWIRPKKSSWMDPLLLKTIV